MTIKANVLEELKDMLLTNVIGCKPNKQDVHHWKEEATDIASSIQMNLFPEGNFFWSSCNCDFEGGILIEN